MNKNKKQNINFRLYKLSINKHISNLFAFFKPNNITEILSRQCEYFKKEIKDDGQYWLIDGLYNNENYIYGSMGRIQTTNLPTITKNDDEVITTLAENEALVIWSAFVFDSNKDILALESKHSLGVGPGMFCKYFEIHHNLPNDAINCDIIIDPEILKKFENATQFKKFELKISDVSMFSEEQHSVNQVLKSIENTNARTLSFGIAGRLKSSKIKDFFDFFNTFTKKCVSVLKIDAKSEIGEWESLNFISHVVDIKMDFPTYRNQQDKSDAKYKKIIEKYEEVKQRL